MKNKILILIILILSIMAYKSSLHKKTTYIKLEENNVTLTDSNTNDVFNVSLEDYVLGVIAGEMPASFDIEALKAQAIASRTYAIYKMSNSSTLTLDTSTQVYLNEEQMKDKWKSNYEYYYERIKSAVRDTEGIIMTYNNEVICSFYFAIGNGFTEDAQLVFGQSLDYLKSVESVDTNVKGQVESISISKDEFCLKLNIECNDINISDIVKTSSGRVESININGITFDGISVRKLLRLRSTDFEINVGEYITITTKGYGHGVGMSQYGANNLALQGYTYIDILNHYYQNITFNYV